MMTPEDYLELAKAAEAGTVYGVDLARKLARHGCLDLTCCPECLMPGFQHTPDCKVPARVEAEMRAAEI